MKYLLLFLVFLFSGCNDPKEPVIYYDYIITTTSGEQYVSDYMPDGNKTVTDTHMTLNYEGKPVLVTETKTIQDDYFKFNDKINNSYHKILKEDCMIQEVVQGTIEYTIHVQLEKE